MKNFFAEIIKPVIGNIEKFPQKYAFCINQTFYTYNEFGESISKIRKVLKGLKGDIKQIGLVANNDIETYASIFALWLENKYYVPLNPADPISRINQMIDQVSIQAILDSSDTTRFYHKRTILTKNLICDCTNFSLPIDYIEDELTYVLFTSGSTGYPKAVPITRKNLMAFLDSFISIYSNFSVDDKCLQCNNLTFDVSVHSFLIPLMHGACVFTVAQNQIAYSYIYELLENYNLTIVFIGPSTIRYLRPYFDEINLPAVKYCVFAGEELPLDILKEWSKCIPNAIIQNHYGPTECTTYCTFSQFDRRDILANKSYNGIFNIGRPYNGVRTILIDSNNDEVNTGCQGELCLAGDQLTKGYLNSNEKNATSFFIRDGIRYYKTGDICYMDDEKNIMFVGRLDSQVQIYGYRVELGEIEFHAKKKLYGINICVVAFENKIGNTEIVLFLECEPIDIKKIRENLDQVLPSYMVPTQFIFTAQFPLNSNGKTDKLKLKSLIK